MTPTLLRRIVFLAACAALAAGCSGTFEPKKIDYKSAGKLPPLDVPPDLTQPTADDRFAVPDISPSGTATYSAYTKDRSGQVQQGAGIAPAALKDGSARIERSGTQRWLLVPVTPEQAWPVVKEFWQENGFIVNIEKPETGVMETDWAENRAKIPQDFIRSTLGKFMDSWYSTAERDKFRTRLERTQDGMGTEIFISHRGMYEVLEGGGGGPDAQRTVWQPRPADPDLEAEMLTRLMVRFGVQEERARSMVTAAGGVDRARLVKEAGGGGAVVMSEPFDRAWRRVGLALDRVGFTVEDRDRASGTYFVRYVDPTKQDTQANKGILDKLFSWSSSGSKAKPEQFRVEVREAADVSQVRVLSAAGAPDKSEAGTRILTLLYDQLK